MTRNLELEAEIRKSPDDPTPYQVYADWLSQQGDPRGELISLSLAAERDTSSDVSRRLAELHAAHDAIWAPPLPEHVRIWWKRGFVNAIKFGDDESAAIDMPAAYAAWRAATKDAPAYALLESITLGAFDDEADYMPDYSATVAAMVEHGVPSTVRDLRIDRGSYWDISNTQVGDISTLCSVIPQLESLYIELGHMELGTLDWPQLRSFEVYTGGFSADNMKSVLEANWPKLERLILRFGSNEDYGASTEIADVLPLFSQQLPHLRELAIANAPFTNEVIEPLAKAPFLKQLHVLDLSWGFLDDNGVRKLLEHAEKFRHLTVLNVGDSYIKDLGSALKEALPMTVGLNDQKGAEADDDWRYCHIGE